MILSRRVLGVALSAVVVSPVATAAAAPHVSSARSYCTHSQLSATFPRTEGAAGTIFADIDITNTSAHTCWIYGGVPGAAILITPPRVEASLPAHRENYSRELLPGQKRSFAVGFEEPAFFQPPRPCSAPLVGLNVSLPSLPGHWTVREPAHEEQLRDCPPGTADFHVSHL